MTLAGFGVQRMMLPMRPPVLQGLPRPNWDQEFAQVTGDTKGKGKAQDAAIADLEERFRELSAEEAVAEATGRHPDYMSDFEK